MEMDDNWEAIVEQNEIWKRKKRIESKAQNPKGFEGLEEIKRGLATDCKCGGAQTLHSPRLRNMIQNGLGCPKNLSES